jgi:hypothetical protein
MSQKSSFQQSAQFVSKALTPDMDEVSGEGDAELIDDASIKIEFAYDNGDEAVLTARR